MNQDAYAAYIGIDWSDRKHDIYLYDCATGEAEESVIINPATFVRTDF